MRVIAQKTYISPLGLRIRCNHCNALLMVDNENDVTLATPPYSRDSHKAWLFDCPICKHEGYAEAKQEMQPC